MLLASIVEEVTFLLLLSVLGHDKPKVGKCGLVLSFLVAKPVDDPGVMEPGRAS